MDIEPLLLRLQTLAPGFGRASTDIEAMIGRGRSGDFKGVMQNCRLVLEALLRALVSDELKQTPGKAMLDELITKFRQQANAGVIPTNILAHMGTVQAWGNLSSHDHATKLTDEGVTVGKNEVMASLNSMVAILEWYSGRFGHSPAKGTPAVVASSAPAAAAPAAPKGKAPVIPIAIAAVALIGVGGWFATRPTAAATEEKGSEAKAAVDPTALLDGQYARWNEPLPPGACRSPGEVAVLGSKFSDLAALQALPDSRSAEAWYLIARAQHEQKHNAADAVTKALACPGFANAFNLAGKIAIKDQRLADALPNFRSAVAAAPDFHHARFNLGVLHLKEGRTADGISELRQITLAEPKFADAHFFLGVALEGQQQTEEAKAEFCSAFKHGNQDAKSRCER